MKKILVVIILLIVVAAAYFGYKLLVSNKTTSSQTPTTTQLCDLGKQTCTGLVKSSNSGNLKVTILNGVNPVKNLETDLAIKPGNTQYYMRITNELGVALFEGLPTGNYFIYFNEENFPSELGNPPTEKVQVTLDKTSEIEIHL